MSSLSFSDSPFDKIRHIDEQGFEFWIARELMPLLGYPRWAEFKSAIDRAMISSQNMGNPVEQHFSGLTLKTSGRPSEDFKLSRYGCHLVAMNGDPRKPEIAAAQTYFSAQTHEMEKMPPVGSAQWLLYTAQRLVEQCTAAIAIESTHSRIQSRRVAAENC